MGRDIDGADRLAARRIERIEAVAGGEPDMAAVIADAMHTIDALERAVLADDFGCRSFHGCVLGVPLAEPTLVVRQRHRE
jgi:hypothetical protein